MSDAPRQRTGLLATEAAEPVKANELYKYFVDRVKQQGIKVETGVFQAMMRVSLTNDGPVTILLDSRSVRSSEC